MGKSGEKCEIAAKSGNFFSQNGRRRPFWMTENHFRSHFSPFQINTELFIFFFKMAASSHFGSQFLPKSIGTYLHRSSMAVSNMNLIRALVSQLRETQALACGGGGCGGCGGGGVQTKTIISPKFQILGI